ncbi:MAG: hypothetical protein H0U74_12170 [Bradymonadaceae bacterium]|nr:hypothetical protein [Lujinxingiaceae bacterium]
MTTLEFHALPTLSIEYARALSRLNRPGFKEAMPQIEAIARGIKAEPERVAAYNSVCGIADPKRLLASYPQVLATPLHGAIFASPEFPFGPLGMVHVGNRIVQHAVVGLETPLDLRARLGASREVARGIEFELETFAEVSGQCVWQSTTSILVRQRKSKAPKGAKLASAQPLPGESAGRTRSVIFRIPEDMGRRYAGVSGDFNPIHLHALIARPFGFSRAIVQGMWSLARCLGELGDELGAVPHQIDVRFERPIELPARVLFSSGASKDGVEFAMKKADGSKVYLEGQITKVQ